jgi:hypothetical protein
VNPLHERFQEYFSALDRSGQEDRCYVCRRTCAEVKLFLGFNEDGLPVEADEYGIEDITILDGDIMSYRGIRPVCAVCQLNFDTLFALGEQAVIQQLLAEMERCRDDLWPKRAD